MTWLLIIIVAWLLVLSFALWRIKLVFDYIRQKDELVARLKAQNDSLEEAIKLTQEDR